MILSHDHKFIYIKTCKTGSSSVEAVLSGVCGPDDVITQASEELRDLRQRPAQNFRLQHPAVPRRPLWRRLLRRPERHYHPSVGFYEHVPAWRVRQYVGEEIWRSYFKFSFERNPWDRQVSWYHHKTKFRSDITRPSFDQFNKSRRRARIENWELYTIDGNIAVDFVGRYENLDNDFATVLNHIGLRGQLALPRINRSNRGEGGYRHYYTDASRDLIASWYAPEIREFGYEF